MPDLPRAYLWMVDRWRTSEAYLTLDAPAQGCYRNIIDELWLRGGKIPNTDHALMLASGSPKWWGKVKAKVMERLIDDGEFVSHAGTTELIEHAKKRLGILSEAGKKGNAKRWAGDRHPIATRSPGDPNPNRSPSQTQTQRDTADSPGLLADDSPGPPAALIPCTRGKTYELTEAQVDEWVATYPGVDVRQEIREAIAWLRSHPKRNKTLRGMPAYFTAWLGREQDKGGNGKRHDPSPESSVTTQPAEDGGLFALDEAKRAELRRASDERIRAALLARDERERRLGGR